MTSSNLCLVTILSLGTLIEPTLAQEAPGHRHPPGEVHGQVHLPTSCAAEVQPAFDVAVAQLHSFGYDESRQGFLQVAERDPRCGMAWWGVAMSYFHQHWDQPTPEELAAGVEAAAKAREIGAASERERGYIEAIGAFYHDAENVEHAARARAYAEAMGQVAARFAEDDEASIFHALALLASRRPDDTSLANQRRAGEILNRLLPEHPDHPGIVHYTIHAFDYPELAEWALPAARVYAEVAPASPHALHMPSHVFTRLGLWEESIASNREVRRVAAERLALTDPGAVAFESLHAGDYLVYAHLQRGEEEEARRVVEEMRKAKKFDQANFAVAYALVSAPARYALERRDWPSAAALPMPAVELRWQDFPYARANGLFANAMGAARMGDLEGARAALAKLAALGSSLSAEPPRGPYDWAGKVEALRLAAAGWLAHAEGDAEAAVASLRRGAALEEKVGKHAVTPGSVLPAREQLGDLLLELERPAEALEAYEAALAENPGRFHSLAGAGRAAELTGEPDRARGHYEALLSLCRGAGCDRPAARRAAAYVEKP